MFDVNEWSPERRDMNDEEFWVRYRSSKKPYRITWFSEITGDLGKWK